MRLTLALSSCLCAGAQAFRAVGLYAANAVFAAGMADRGDKPEVQRALLRAALPLDFLR